MYGHEAQTIDKCQMNAMYELECNVQEQISDNLGVDGLVCDAGNLELDALVNWKPVIMFKQSTMS